MEAKHTPGPWMANGQHVYADDFLSMKIAFCSNGAIMGNEESFEITRRIAEANARLIAAAPELLGALEDAEEFAKETLPGSYLHLKIGYAIAKAKGGEND